MISHGKQFKYKKITIIIPSLNGGGAESTAVNLANMFCKNNYEVKIICIYSSKNVNHNLSENINVTFLNQDKIYQSILKIRKILSNLDSSFIISFLTATNIALSIAKLFLKKKHFYLLTQHEIPSLNLAKSRYFYLVFLIKVFYPFADAIICVSKGLESELKELLPNRKSNKIYTIYNIIEKNCKFKRNRSKPYKLLSVGRLVKAKDFPTLIKAIYILKNQLEFKLTIIGNGPEKNNLNNLIRRLGLEEICEIKNFQNGMINNMEIFIFINQYSKTMKVKKFILMKY